MSEEKIAPKETKVTQLSPNRVLLAEHAHQTFVACPETGTPPDALLDSRCWAHYSVNPGMEINPGDIILVKPEDGTYFMELMVRDKYRGGLKVVELRRVMLDKTDDKDEELSEYDVKYSGPNIKWRVIRKADKRELKNGLASKTAAHDWLREHEKALAA